jgi:hypothetical protein
MQVAGSPGQARETVGSADPKTPPGVPSWGRVLATTISLWASRRLHHFRRRRSALLLLTICALVLSVGVVGVVRFTGTSARVSSPGRPHQGQARPGEAAEVAGSSGVAGSLGSVRSQAAAWIASQVSSSATIACDPLMCAALQAHGVAASRLVPLGSSASGAPGANVIAASPSADVRLSQETPALLASFGSGASLIEVRATSPGGVAAYQPALQADLAARRSAGAQLLHSGRLAVSAQGAGQLRAGQVDSRLLIMLAMLAAQHPWRVVAFGDPSPGVPFAAAPFRQVILASADGRGGTGALAAALVLVRAQHTPFQPARVGIIRLADGQAGLLVDFAAPSLLGLLTGGARG